MPLKGYRERIKQAKSYEEATGILVKALAAVSPKAAIRCRKAFGQWTQEHRDQLPHKAGNPATQGKGRKHGKR